MDSETKTTLSAKGSRSGWPLMVALAITFFLAYLLRYVLLPFVAAAALAYIAEPLVKWLCRHTRLPRWAAAAPPYVLYLGIFTGLGYLIGWRLAVQFRQLAGSIRAFLERVFNHLFGGTEVHWDGRTLKTSELADYLINQAGKWLGSAAPEVATTGAAAVGGTFLILVLLVYFMAQGPQLIERVTTLAPPTTRPQIQGFLARINPVLGRYLRGLFVIVILTSFLSWLGITWWLGLKGAILLAVASGVLELIPVVGPILSATLVGVVAVEHGSVTIIFKLALYFTAIRLLIDQVLGPLVLGRAAQLHPTAILFAFVAGGALFGPLGLLLAVPAAAILKMALEAAYKET